MDLHEVALERQINPVDMVEQVASVNDWSFCRDCDDEISILVNGSWTQYQVSFSWMEDREALHLACAFDLKIPKERNDEARRLLSLVNEQMLVGHFDIWFDEGSVMFRQALLLNGGVAPTSAQLEYQLSSGLDACEQYYQAFQLVVWAGYDAKEAIASALFETHGNA